MLQMNFEFLFLLYFITSVQNNLISKKLKHQVDSVVSIKTLLQYSVIEMEIFDQESAKTPILSTIQLAKINRSIYLETDPNKKKQFCNPDLKSLDYIVGIEIVEDENNERLNGLVFNSNINMDKPDKCTSNEIVIDNNLYYFLFQNKVPEYTPADEITLFDFGYNGSNLHKSLLEKKCRTTSSQVLKKKGNKKFEVVSNNLKKNLLKLSKAPEKEIFCSSECTFQFSLQFFHTFKETKDFSKSLILRGLIVFDKMKRVRDLDAFISDFISYDGNSELIPTLLQSYCVASGKKKDELPEKKDLNVSMKLLKTSEPRRLCNFFSRIKKSQSTKSLYEDLVTIQVRSPPQFIEPCGRAPKNGEPRGFYQGLLFWNFLFQLGLTILFSFIFLYSKLNFIHYLSIGKGKQNSNDSRQKIPRTVSKQKGSGKESGSEAIGSSNQ